MNKQDLTDAVSRATGDSKVTTAQVVDAFTDIVATSLAKGEAVQLIGFGTFGTGERAARTGRNPATGEAMQIAAAKTVSSQPAKRSKNASTADLMAREAEQQALRERIRASREDGGAAERERSKKRHLAEIENFRLLVSGSTSRPRALENATSHAARSSFKPICTLIAQRASEDPAWLEPALRKDLRFLHKMVQTPERWLAIADELAQHEACGISRELTAFGPFAGLRVSIRALLVTAGVTSVAQLRDAIAAGSIALAHDISNNGFTRRRWTELNDWLARQSR
jgi:nucleoid DNA-binding protein